MYKFKNANMCFLFDLFKCEDVLFYQTGMGNPILMECWPVGRLFIEMGLPILVRWCLYIENS